MSVLSDATLIERIRAEKIITPFLDHLLRSNGDGLKIISHGLSSYGYDVVLARDVKVFTNISGGIVDPKNMHEAHLQSAEIRMDHNDNGIAAEYVVLPPNSYLLGHTREVFRMPNDLLCLCLGKSTYARAGIQINVTPIEPGFEGQVVIEIANATNLPVRVYVNEGIAQFIFLKGDQPCRVSYADRKGKYQGQSGITHSKV